MLTRLRGFSDSIELQYSSQVFASPCFFMVRISLDDLWILFKKHLYHLSHYWKILLGALKICLSASVSRTTDNGHIHFTIKILSRNLSNAPSSLLLSQQAQIIHQLTDINYPKAYLILKHRAKLCNAYFCSNRKARFCQGAWVSVK